MTEIGRCRVGDFAGDVPQHRATFGEVFGVAEFRALWLALVLSVSGDQLARVALTVLVYDRTRSALLAAVTFAASVVPLFVGGVTLSGLADRLPRRRVMIACDVVSCALVAVMALPRMPLAALIVLLFTVTISGAPFLAARSAILPDILVGDRYVVGVGVSMTTSLFAQAAGFAAGGALLGFLGARTSLLADAGTFAASALITRVWVRARPAVRPQRPSRPAGHPHRASRPGAHGHRGSAAGRRRGSQPVLAEAMAGLRLVFGRSDLRTPVLFGWLSAFYGVPEGLATPLARVLGGGALTVGLILAAQAFGTAAGTAGFTRFIDPVRRMRWVTPLAVSACGILILFAPGPRLAGALLILAASGLFGCYQLAANAMFVRAAPSAQRSQAFGVAQGGMSLGQATAMIAAGAVAGRISPATVIAIAGCAGAVCALAVASTKGSGKRTLALPSERSGPASRRNGSCSLPSGHFRPTLVPCWQQPGLCIRGTSQGLRDLRLIPAMRRERSAGAE
jgi:MFS family permease